jgi:predicted trehalose synthase
VLLRAFEVEKETYELVYAATFLPEWMPIASASLAELCRDR